MKNNERLTLGKLHIGFSRALHIVNQIFNKKLAGAIYKQLNEKLANAKLAPSPTPALIGWQVVIHSIARDPG